MKTSIKIYEKGNKLGYFFIIVIVLALNLKPVVQPLPIGSLAIVKYVCPPKS